MTQTEDLSPGARLTCDTLAHLFTTLVTLPENDGLDGLQIVMKLAGSVATMTEVISDNRLTFAPVLCGHTDEVRALMIDIATKEEADRQRHNKEPSL